VLLHIALAVFAIFGILSLVVDLGFVRLTQVQMQNAADTAAIEGLRERDLEPDPFRSDCMRRTTARNFVSWTFDDDYDPAADALQLGAGPHVALSPGFGDVQALQTIDLNAPRVYDPILQRNQASNAQYGDLVSGSFLGGSFPVVEDGAYSRSDFVPAGPVPPAGGLSACPPDDDFTGVPASSGTIPDDSFLVRLRRSNEASDPDISSTGPAIQLLFGRAATVGGTDPVTGYNVRRDGLTVRATAIARTRGALRVSVPHPSVPEYLWPVSFGVSNECWRALIVPAGAAGISEPATIDSAGTIAIPAVPECAATAGQFIAQPPPPDGLPCLADSAGRFRCSWRVTDRAEPQPTAAGPIEESGLVAIFETLGPAPDLRVVGFGRAAVCGSVDQNDPLLCATPATIPGSVVFAKGSGRVAARHASAHLQSGFHQDLDPAHPLTSADIRSILDANLALVDPLVVPVIAR
jgi:hypothetical protein